MKVGLLIFLIAILVTEFLVTAFIHPDFFKMGRQFISDPKLIYRHRPGYQEKDLTINKYGLRGALPPHFEEDNGKKKRILILGDSMVYGHGVTEQENFPSLLNTMGVGHVLNGGVKGYGSDQVYLLFQELKETLKPDIVLFAFNHNDLYDNAVKRRLSVSETKIDFLKEETLYASLFVGFYENVFSYVPSRLLQYLVTKGLLVFSSQKLKNDFDLSKEQKRVVWTMQEMKRAAKREAYDIKFLVLPHVTKGAKEFTFLKNQGLQEELIFFDKFENKDFLDSDVHFSPSGHRKMVKELLTRSIL